MRIALAKEVTIILLVVLISTTVILIASPSPILRDANSQKEQQQQFSANDIFRKVEKSIVAIETSLSEGSGFVYANAGNIVYIVTNTHVVVSENPDRQTEDDTVENDTVEISFSDGSTYTANVSGIDLQGDIAFLKIIWNTTTQNQSPEPLTMGNSSELHVGEQVIAIGSPTPDEQPYFNLLTSGVISKVGIEALVPDPDIRAESILNAIVTDAVIDDGSSGGPLLNMEGQVIGMNTAADEESACCTYAIPSNTITHIIPVLNMTGQYVHPYIGLESRTLTSHLIAENYENLQNTLKGVLVTQIDKDGPAHIAGINGSVRDQFGELSSGDIITAIDGKPITTADEFNGYIDENKYVNDNVTLTLYKNGTKQLPLNVTLKGDPNHF